MAFEGIRGDIAIYKRDGDGKWWKKAGFWCSATYRVGALAHRVESRPLKYAILAAHKVLATPWRVLKGVHIPHNAIIGPGLRIPHPQNIIIAPGGVFGADCSIYQDVTTGRGPEPGVPTVGNRVALYPGARVLGGVSIGDDARIGANVVVTRDIPVEAIVSVAPAKVIPKEMAERFARTPSVPPPAPPAPSGRDDGRGR